jgi:putative ABC transport system permease protein
LLALGTVGALATTRLLQAFLFDVTPTDPATFAMVAALLALAGLSAAAVPAWRAARVDPTRALHAE